MDKELLQILREKRTTYADMIDFCCDHILRNNYIYDALVDSGYEFEIYCGNLIEYYNQDGDEITEEEYNDIDGGYISHVEIMQYYLISSSDAERISEYTKEIVVYNEDLDLYILCVTHYGTPWEGVNARWKEV